MKRSRAGLGPDTNITVCKSFNTLKRLSPPDQDHLRPCSTAAVRFNEAVCYPFAKPEGTGPALHGDCALPPLAADLCQREGKAVWASHQAKLAPLCSPQPALLTASGPRGHQFIFMKTTRLWEKAGQLTPGYATYL